MNTLTSFLGWLQATPTARQISESAWLFPCVEIVHVLAVSIVVGSIAMIDLRLLGCSSRDRAVDELVGEVLKWTWVAFGIAVASGALLFASAALKYWDTTPFRLKMGLIGLAGLNMVLFHSTVYRQAQEWGNAGAGTPPSAKVFGGISLTLWIAIVGCGRWIGFV